VAKSHALSRELLALSLIKARSSLSLFITTLYLLFMNDLGPFFHKCNSTGFGVGVKAHCLVIDPF
jgi:hypothetical protein